MAEESGHIMDELLIKYLAGEHSPSEGQEIELWLAESEENRTHLGELRKVWEMMEGVSEKELAVIDEAWKRFQDRIGEKSARSIGPMWGRRWLRVAAVLLVGLAFVGGVLALLNLNAGSGIQQLVNQSPEPLKQTLADGSDVFLRSGAMLTYPEAFEGEIRTVQLEGEAFFEIERDTLHPFIIQTKGTEIEVLGTSFLVRALAEETETEVIVESGKVEVRSRKALPSGLASKQVLLKGMSARYTQAKQTVEIASIPIEEIEEWVPQKFLFNNLPMQEVARQLSEAFGRNIEFVLQDSTECLFQGEYERGVSLDHILTIIKFNRSYEVEKTETGYLIKGVDCQQQ